jgi:hypothetical protein
MSPNENGDDRVPLFGTWRTAYIVVVIAFLLNVAVFYAITRIFA